MQFHHIFVSCDINLHVTNVDSYHVYSDPLNSCRLITMRTWACWHRQQKFHQRVRRTDDCTVEFIKSVIFWSPRLKNAEMVNILILPIPISTRLHCSMLHEKLAIKNFYCLRVYIWLTEMFLMAEKIDGRLGVGPNTPIVAPLNLLQDRHLEAIHETID